MEQMRADREVLTRFRRNMRQFGNNKYVRRVTLSRFAIPAVVFCCYFALNLGISGPAYMSDEIGYLDKAATIAGSTVHMSTGWFGGYSLMVSPAYLLSSDPYTEWIIILLLNALMWAGSAYLLLYVLEHTHPSASPKAVRLAVLGAMAYPSWISMSGYAFSTSGFVVVYMGALAALVKSGLRINRWLYISGLLAGYLCWIHPLGVVFLGLFIALLAMQGVLKRQWRWLLAPLGSVAVAGSYLVVVQPLLDRVMQGTTGNDDHYAQGISGIIHTLLTPHAWLQTGEALVGLVFFVVVASFGLAVYGALPIIKHWYEKRRSWRKAIRDSQAVVLLVALLAVVLAIGCTAIATGTTRQPRVDQWVYGRYTDMYLLPLIGFGLLTAWRARQALVLALYAAAAGIFLSLVTNPNNTAFIFNNKVNLQGLWPMHLASLIHANYYWLWGILGAAAIAATAVMGRVRQKGWLLLLLLPISLAAVGNYLYHRTILQQHSTVSSLYVYLKDNYQLTDCIGFAPGADSEERFNLYSYYLHGYDLNRMTLQQWQQKRCTGPYLAYDVNPASGAGLRIIGQEVPSGLYVIAPAAAAVAGSHQAGSPSSAQGNYQPLVFR